MNYKFFRSFELPQEPAFPERNVSISDFGAVENTLCTESINRAISETAKLGGGRVTVPRGQTLCLSRKKFTERISDFVHPLFSFFPAKMFLLTA